MHRILSYLKASSLLHIITLLELGLFVILWKYTNFYGWLDDSNWPIRSVILVYLVGLPLFAQLDARSRFQNYKMVKDHLYVYGFNTRIISLFMKSKCQRDAAFSAAKELRMGKACKTFFRTKGYRWYHVFPDMVFSKPWILLTKNFWMATLFVKTYHSKIDLEKKQMQKQKIKKPSFQMAMNKVSI